ncbi:50S ribosomal protein L34e [Candidatus Woesearchaeota archaeon]|nr:50S ribosomal protein L34e [Candidatus Woesearchaeota archaeon]
MPRGMFKSRTLRRVMKRVPGGKAVKRYEPRNPGAARCAITGEPLHGVPRKTPNQLAKLPKTMRRPQRPYGGVLGSRASRQLIKEEARETQ